MALPLVSVGWPSQGPIRSLRASKFNTPGAKRPQSPSSAPQKLKLCESGAVVPASATLGNFLGTGISDLRATVTAQQRQLDSLVEKVAALLAAMHAEVLQDVQSAKDQAGAAAVSTKEAQAILAEQLQPVAAAAAAAAASGGGELEQLESYRLFTDVRLSGLEEDLNRLDRTLPDKVREALAASDRLASEVQCIKDETRSLTMQLQEKWPQEAQELRKLPEEFAKEVKALGEHVAGGMEDLNDNLATEIRHVQAQVEEEVHELHGRLGSLERQLLEQARFTERAEPTWQLAIDDACDALGEELQMSIDAAAAAAARAQESCAQQGSIFAAKLEELEQRLATSFSKSVNTQEAARFLAAQDVEKLHRLELDAQRQRAMLERLRDIPSPEWRLAVDRRLEASVTSRGFEQRVAPLERLCQRQEEVMEQRLVQLRPQRERLDALEQRVAALADRFSSGFSAAPGLEQRITELGGRVSTLASSLAEDTQRLRQRMAESEQQLGDLVAVVERHGRALPLAANYQASRSAQPAPFAAPAWEPEARGSGQVEEAYQQRAGELEQKVAAQEAGLQRLSVKLERHISDLQVAKVAPAAGGATASSDSNLVLESSSTAETRAALASLTEQLDQQASLVGELQESVLALRSEAAQASLTGQPGEQSSPVSELQDGLTALRSEVASHEAQLEQLRGALAAAKPAEEPSLEGSAAFLGEASALASLTGQMDQQGLLVGELQESVLALRSEVASHDSVLAQLQSAPLVARGAEEPSLGETAASIGGDKHRELEESLERCDAALAACGQLEESLHEKLGQCDAAMRSCYRSAEAVEEEIRERIQEVAESLQSQLAEAISDGFEGLHAVVSSRRDSSAAAAAALPAASNPPSSRRGSARSGCGEEPLRGALSALASRMRQQESSLEALQEENRILRGHLEGERLEQKVSRCLAGLEDEGDAASPGSDFSRGASDM